MINFNKAILIGISFLITNAGLGDSVKADEQKPLQIIIGTGVGSSDDLWGHLIGRFIGTYLPNKPNVIVSNLPGAGSMMLANQMYNTQPKDGSVIGVINRGLPFEKLLGGQGVLFDAQQFTYIGSPDIDTQVCEVRTDAPVQTISDLRDKELILGSTGTGADSLTYPLILTNLIGLKIKIVQGYPGSREILLAIERNEVQGGCNSYTTVTNHGFYRDGYSHILFQGSLDPDPSIAAASMIDVAQTDAQREVLALFLKRQQIGRPYILPPHVPQEKIILLRAAFAAALRDPALIQEADKIGLHVHYIAPDHIEHIIADAYKTSPDIVHLTQKVMGR
jgi:tripartite-type tricarboxylate transporter receptor subunit TctC